MTRKELRLGIVEEAGPSAFSYDLALLSQTEPYAAPFRTLSSRFFSGAAYPQWGPSGLRFALQIVHVCEEAKRWSKAGTDCHVERADYFDEAAEDFAEASGLVRRLSKFERKHPYLFSYALKAALEQGLPEQQPLNVQVSDANHPKGGPTHRASKRTRVFIEHTAIWKIAFESGEFLQAFECGLSARPRNPEPYRFIGCLSFDPPLGRRAAAKLRTDVVGLAGWLALLMRNWTQSQTVEPMYSGTEMPNHGTPCWNLVADFVNATLASDTFETEDSVRQKWHSLTSSRTVRLHPWPRPALREPQAN